MATDFKVSDIVVYKNKKWTIYSLDNITRTASISSIGENSITVSYDDIILDEEKQTNSIYDDLREIKHFFGGWDELREIIKVLEQEDNEAAYERRNGDAWEGGIADNH